jgi:hypothetical protein
VRGFSWDASADRLLPVLERVAARTAAGRRRPARRLRRARPEPEA